VQGPRGGLDGLNVVGLKRRGVDRTDITALQSAYRALAGGDGSFHDRAARLAADTDSAYVLEVAEFVLSATGRSYLTPG